MAKAQSSAGGGGLGGLLPIDTLTSYGMNAMGASMAHDRAKNMITRGYLYQQEGLEKAGLNRILAVGQGIQGGLPGSAKQAHAVSTGGKKNPVLDALQAQNLSANTAKQTAEGRVANADASVAEANALYRLSTEGRDNYARNLTNQSLPDSVSGMVGKGAFGAQSTAKGLWQQHSPNFMPAIREALRRGHRTPTKKGQWNFQLPPTPGQRKAKR